MLKATAGKILPTTITGSLPRPSWYTENLGTKAFLDAMVISRYREQYVDALSAYLRVAAHVDLVSVEQIPARRTRTTRSSAGRGARSGRGSPGRCRPPIPGTGRTGRRRADPRGSRGVPDAS